MSYHLVQNKIMKFLRSSEVNYNFNKVTGYLERWGRTKEEDPVYAPFPEILDIEVTSICAGPDNKNCSFCSPAGTIVNTPNGDVDIKNIKVGDVVWSATSLGTQKPRMRHNVVEEVYTREYDGELICIELENGKVLKLTPEHPVMVKGGIEVLAGELTMDHEIIHMDDFEKCHGCGCNIDGSLRHKRFFCSEKCFETHEMTTRTKTCLICNTPFIGKSKNSVFCCTSTPEGESTHRLATIWDSMIRRCYDPDRRNFKYYGGKGITVAPEWLSLGTFINDMSGTFVEGSDLERIDNDQGYCKNNCTWISKRESRQHRSQPINSQNPYKGCSPHKGKYILEVPSANSTTGEYIGIFETQKECVDIYNKRIMDLYPVNGHKYTQEYKGEL